jgi:hypothetical protein
MGSLWHIIFPLKLVFTEANIPIRAERYIILPTLYNSGTKHIVRFSSLLAVLAV